MSNKDEVTELSFGDSREKATAESGRAAALKAETKPADDRTIAFEQLDTEALINGPHREAERVNCELAKSTAKLIQTVLDDRKTEMINIPGLKPEMFEGPELIVIPYQS